MASIFTFESEPPSLSSPWPGERAEVAKAELADGKSLLAGMKMPLAVPLADFGITKLEAEPQEGPIEYKLHLLLRPRRSFSATSTVQHVSGSYLSKSRVPQRFVKAEIRPTATSSLAPNSQSRQNRLQHLTTQLLWRLQQSSPYHSSSKSSLVLPVLPDTDVQISSSKGPGRLIPGLEESSGALYEIGVSDDGTFVGLTRDELEESLTVLRAMAFSLGCYVQILRVVIVGDCEWSEEAQTTRKAASRPRQEKLLVAEVLVAPHLGPSKPSTELVARACNDVVATPIRNSFTSYISDETQSQSEQIRVSLTGSTTSGKSSLLGTLSTSTLDNGRGKSRLSLLKHRHEIVSGVTSSLAQELIGYQEVALGTNASAFNSNVINHASGNISSWNDIHAASERGRLVFLTDSAGHPRYRRTTVRGLVSWAPHWTLCCVAADDGEDSTGSIGATSSSEVLGSAGFGVDLSKAHLELCLKLNLLLVIVITKLDIASKIGLRNTLTKVLNILKAAGRKPDLLPSYSGQSGEPQLHSIAKDEEDMVRRKIAAMSPTELHLLVPIVLTSAVTGTGIGQLHAVLKQLPANLGTMVEHANLVGQDATRPQSLFHVDEVFSMPSHTHTASGENTAPTFVLSGYLRSGVLEVGHTMLIGPCNPIAAAELAESPYIHRARSYPGLVKGSPRTAATFHDRQRPCSSDSTGMTVDVDASTDSLQTWQEVHINGLRNLRLPVKRLLAGQVGTVAITFKENPSCKGYSSSNSPLRRGMVMVSGAIDPKKEPYPAFSRFTAVFPQPSLPAWPAVLVIVYIASIRATAKIIEVKAVGTTPTTEDVFDFHDDENSSHRDGSVSSQSANDQQTEITFEFVASREWIEIGTQVFVTPGGGPSLTNQPEQREPGSAGLDGYVGLITQAVL